MIITIWGFVLFCWLIPQKIINVFKKMQNNEPPKISPQKSLLAEIFFKTKFCKYSISIVKLNTLENKGSYWGWGQALSYRGVNWWHCFSSEKYPKTPQYFIAYTESLIHAHCVHLKILFGNCVNSCKQLSDTSFPVKIKIIHIHLYPTLNSTTNIHFITCSCHHLTHIFTFVYI